MSKVSVKSKHLFYFMENNKMRTVVMTSPQLRNKRKNKYLAYTKSRLFTEDFSSLGEHL